MKKLYLLLFFGLAITFNAFGQSKTKSTEPRKGESKPDKLVGTWKVVEYVDFDSATSKWINRYGKDPRGYFIYTKGGIVAITVSTGNPVKISEDSAKNMSVNYYQNYYSNSFSYFGTYTVDWKKSMVTHYVKGGSLLWYIDTDQPREFILKGDTLTIGDSKTWKRVLVKID